MLKIVSVASRMSADGSMNPVPSEAHPTGGGRDPEREWVDFHIDDADPNHSVAIQDAAFHLEMAHAMLVDKVTKPF